MTASPCAFTTLLVAALLGAGLFMPERALGDEKPVCVRIGHRGAPTLAPENTLASVRAALKVGVDGVEFDVWPTADRKMIVLHDDRLQRTTDGGNARVPEKTLAELRQLDAGSWGPWADGKFAGEKLPLPEEMVRQAFRGGAFPVVHLKDGKLIPDIMRVLAEEKALRRAVIFCFEYPAMKRLAKEYPHVRKAWLVGKSDFEKIGIQGVVSKAAAVKCDCLAPEAGQVTPALIAACHAAKLPVWTWTVDDPKRMEQLLRMGVDGIVTNVPQALNATLARMREHD
jgi:glycerophosphoryl diester phosphodiesterase